MPSPAAVGATLEFTAATLENARREGESYIFSLAWSKTKQAGRERAENDKPVVGRAMAAPLRLAGGSGIAPGPIFRRAQCGVVVAEPLSAGAVRAIVRKR